MIIYSINGYQKLAASIAAKTKSQTGEVTTKRFPNGERYMRVMTDPRDQDVVIVGGTVDDAATLDIFDLASGLVTDGCRSLKLVIPFFSYSTMERAVKPGEVVTAKTRARLLSAIPVAPLGNQVILLDLHSEGIPFYFEGTIKTLHLYAKSLILAEARRMGGKDFVLGAVDAGRAKWVESLANDLGVHAGFIYKKRDSQGAVTVSGTNVPVLNKPVVIYDDIIRSGSSVLQACKAYRDAGASEIYVICTHADFTDTAVQNLEKSGLVKAIVCTDSHPDALAAESSFVKVMSTDGIFARALRGDRHVD